MFAVPLLLALSSSNQTWTTYVINVTVFETQDVNFINQVYESFISMIIIILLYLSILQKWKIYKAAIVIFITTFISTRQLYMISVHDLYPGQCVYLPIVWLTVRSMQNGCQ